MSRKAGRVKSNRLIERVRHVAVSRAEPVLPADVSDEQTLGVTAQVLWERCSVWARRALALSTTLGTVFGLSYFLRIGYLPIDSFSSVAALGGVVAGISGVLFASLLLLWAVPTLLIATMSTVKRLGRLDPLVLRVSSRSHREMDFALQPFASCGVFFRHLRSRLDHSAAALVAGPVVWIQARRVDRSVCYWATGAPCACGVYGASTRSCRAIRPDATTNTMGIFVAPDVARSAGAQQRVSAAGRV